MRKNTRRAGLGSSWVAILQWITFHTSCDLVDFSCTYGVFCHVLRHATDAHIVPLPSLSYGSCWCCGVFVFRAVSPGTWQRGAWVPGGPCRVCCCYFHDPSLLRLFHGAHVSLAKWAPPKFESYCADFSYPILQDEPTGPAHIDQLAYEQKNILHLHIWRFSHFRSSHLLSSHLHQMCAPSHLRSSHLKALYILFSHLHHICASSFLRSLSQIFTSSLSSSGLHILKAHLVFTSADLHHVVSSSRFCHLIFLLQRDIFTSSRLHLPALGPTVVQF